MATVKSVLNQTFPDFEIVVVDDAGTDDTESQLKKINDPRIIYVRQPSNRKANAARNAGVAKSRAPWVCFLDSDDLWLPNRLENLKSLIESQKNSEKNIYWSSLWYDRGNGIKQVKPSCPKPESMPVMEYLLCNEGLIQTSTLCMANSVARSFPFDEEITVHDDDDLLMRLEQAGFSLVQDSNPQVVWMADTRADRVSLARGIQNELDWLRKRTSMLTAKARAAFLALHVAPRLTGLKKLQGIWYVLKAWLTRAISTRRSALALCATLLPPQTYQTVIRALLKPAGHKKS